MLSARSVKSARTGRRMSSTVMTSSLIWSVSTGSSDGGSALGSTAVCVSARSSDGMVVAAGGWVAGSSRPHLNRPPCRQPAEATPIKHDSSRITNA